MTRIRLFISSVQKECAAERAALRDYSRSDAQMRRFFKVFLFEDEAAANGRADEIDLDEVQRCDIYVAMFGADCGFEDTAGVSPTEREFDAASTAAKYRLIYVRGAEGAADRTASRDLEDLVRKEVLGYTARTGRGTAYRVVKKPAVNPPNSP